MTQSDRDLVVRFFNEAFNEGNASVIREFVAPEHVSHLPTGDHYGPEGVRIDISGFRSAFSDIHLEIDECFEAGERPDDQDLRDRLGSGSAPGRHAHPHDPGARGDEHPRRTRLNSTWLTDHVGEVTNFIFGLSIVLVLMLRPDGLWSIVEWVRRKVRRT